MPTQRFTIPTGDAGIVATLAIMRQLVHDDAVHPAIREWTAALVIDTGRNTTVQARAIYDWLDTLTQFLPDPSTSEALIRPVDLLERIQTRGIGQIDCDDLAMLAAAMACSIGLRARFVVVAFHPGGPFAHVYTEVAAPDGALWLAVDPTRPAGGLPTITREAIVEV